MSEANVSAAGRVISASQVPYGRIRSELTSDKDHRRGDKGQKVRVIQEWLSLHGHQVAVDGDFGPATDVAVRRYQVANNLAETGVVDAQTFAALIAPMLRVLTPLPAASKPYPDVVVDYARQHFAEHPLEVGGKNCGPWVRLYMQGSEGADMLWCAGFVCFILRQAADTLRVPLPLPVTFSCDTLAKEGQTRGLFVPEANLQAGNPPKDCMPRGSIFLVRHSENDWTHTGLVTAFQQEVIETIEGNTNDSGEREGFEVCARTRSYAGKDFVRLP